VGPPDFAPAVDHLVSLYDVAFQAAIDKGALQPEARPSFARDIKPMIERLADLRWVDDWEQWNVLQPIAWDTLADPLPSAGSVWMDSIVDHALGAGVAAADQLPGYDDCSPRADTTALGGHTNADLGAIPCLAATAACLRGVPDRHHSAHPRRYPPYHWR